MADRITSFRDLEVHQLAFAAAMEIFELTKSFPAEERFSLDETYETILRKLNAMDQKAETFCFTNVPR